MDVSVFWTHSGLTILGQWIIQERCRLVAILGIGGTGKTALSIKLAEQIQAQFVGDLRSLHNALLWIFLLDSLVDVSASHQKLDLSQDIHQQIAKLLDFFKYRCLLVLDNAETILANPNEDPKVNRVGHYRPGFEPYGELFKRLVNSNTTVA